MAQRPPRVSLFVTCLVDQLFPEVGEAVVQLLRRLGVRVEFPPGQTCCGQPAFNSGFHREACAVARRLLDVFQDSEYIVVPSGSCASMVRLFYPGLFHDEPQLQQRAQELGPRVYEVSEFLVKVLGVTDVGAAYQGRVAYHASCHLLRELGVRDGPRQLLQAVRGAEYVPLEEEEACCGFGGTFSVRYPRISQAILEEKLRGLEASGADTLVSCDSSCLMHIGGALARRNSPIKTLHLAQLLARQDGG